MAAAEIYRSIDSNGKVIFTDQPTEKSEKVALKATTEANLSEQDRLRIEENRAWFSKQREKREKEKEAQNAAWQADAPARRSAQRECESAQDSLAYYQRELKARKRAGIKPRIENWYETKIESYEFKVSQKC